KKSGIRLLSIINDIVDISKIEAGQMGTTLSEVNVNEKIEYIHSFFLPQARQKGIYFSYKCSLPSDQARITSDKEKIFAILTNLVNNACKFTQVGSIEFGYERKGPFLEFFVKDTGIGVSQVQKEIIFERFRQGSKELNKNFEGTGLGLSISKAYVEMLGGKIWVESEEGQGSAFYFTIPYITEKQAQSNVPDIIPAEEESGQIKNLKILIAEDDETSDLLITSILGKNNHVFLHAATGIEAISVCRNNPDLDLVLMDIRMPDISGLEAAREIRQFNKRVIIISQTAYALTGDREMAIQAGCNDYIAKPINKDEFRMLIHQHLNNRKQTNSDNDVN
ncbi:MAG: ATP-binding protein, partial [Bacteroidetes bacterium]|nr:ATP-binding protein [Bacteroidota bacterium]